MKILLDTHILIWALENNKDLSRHHRSILANTEHEKIVSQISFIELAVKLNIGKLPDFKIPLHDFITQVEKDGFRILPISNAHISAYPLLPVIPDHKDFFDRFLVVTAMEEKMSFITVDEKLKSYSHLVNLL